MWRGSKDPNVQQWTDLKANAKHYRPFRLKPNKNEVIIIIELKNISIIPVLYLTFAIKQKTYRTSLAIMARANLSLHMY